MPRLNRLPFVLLTVTILLFLQYEKVIAQAPTAEFEANDTVVCVGSVVSFTDLSISGGSAIIGWNWAFGDGGTSTQQNPTYVYSIGGNYTVQLIVTDALNNKDTVTHTIYVLIAQAVQNTIRICSPQTTATIISLDPNIAGVTGTWFTASGATIASASNDTTQISNLISGTYVFFWVVSDGVCSDADQVTVFVDQPIAANANVDQQICTVPGTTNLAGNNPSPGSGIWTTSSTATIANPSNRNTAVSGLTTPGIYTFVWTITNGACANRDTMRITVTSPIAANAGVDQTVCASTTTLAANNPTPGTGVWTTSGSATIANPSSVNSSVSGLILGTNTFIWSVSNGACITRDTVIIVVSQLVNSNAGANITICTSSATTTLNGNNPTPGTGLWTALNGGSITNPASATSTVTGLSTAGTYNFVWTITNGACVSRDSVAVIVNSPIAANAGVDQNICNLRLATLTGNAPAPGTGSWSTSGNATIASPASATTGVSNLAIGNNIFVYTITLGTCITRDTIIVRVDSLVTANAGPNQQICETTTTITLAGNNPTPGTGIWTKLNGGTITTPTSPTSTVTGLTPGQHQFVWTITNGNCISRDTMRVIVNVQIPANAGLDQQICQGTSTFISGNNPSPATGLWTTTSAATIVSPSLATSSVNGFGTPGIYNFIWTVTNGACVQRDTVRITVNAIVNSNAGPDQSICNAITATLAGNSAAPGSGVWTSLGSANVTTPSSATSGVTGLTTGNNQFVWTITNGACITRDTVNIRLDILVASNAGVNQSICLGTTVTLTGNAPTPGTGLWTALNGGTLTTPTSATTNVTGITVAGSYNFVWTITNGSCVSRDTVLITISNQIVADAGSDTSYCALTTVFLDATDVTPAIGTWTALLGGQILDVNDPKTIVDNLNAGLYQFVWEVTNGACITKDTVTILIDTLFVAYAGVDQQICQGDIVTLNGSAPLFGSVVWTALNGGTIVDPGNTITQVVDLDNAGTYSFVWTITNGSCTSTDTVDVVVDSLVIADAGIDQSLCETFDSNLEAEPILLGIGTWSTTGTGVIDDINNPLSLVTGLSYGDNEFVWTVINNNCSSSDTVVIHIDSVIVADAGIDKQICSTTSQVTLSAISLSAGVGQWFSADGFTFNDVNDPSATVAGFVNAGTYILEWTISNGVCISTDTLILIVDSNVVADAGSDQVLCETQDSTTLNANAVNVGIGNWTSTSSAVITDITDPNTSVTSLTVGTHEFFWTITNNTCITVDTVTVIVSSLASPAFAGLPQQACASSNLVVLAANAPLVGVGQWSSLTGATITDVNDPNTTVANLSIGLNTFVWTVTNGLCSSTDTTYVGVTPNPIADAGSDQFVTNGVSVVIGGAPSGSGGIPPLVFSWSPSTFLDNSLLANPTATVTNTQQYILTVADSFGCVGSDTMVVYLNNPPIANTDSVVIDEDSTVVIAILNNDTDLDSNIDSTSIQVSINPTSGVATINTTTGTITFIPNANFFGSDSLQYVICDTGLPVYCDTAWIYITINPVNDAPIAVDDSVTTVEDSCIQIIVLANDSDVENGIVVSSLGTLTNPNNGTITLDTLTGVYTYCPDTNFIGVDTLVYIICDNGAPALCDTAVVIITVNSKNDSPIALDDNVTLCSTDSVVIEVLANDIDPDNDTLSIAIIQNPSNGIAYIDTNQTIIYQPTISSNGIDSIQYLVCDNQTPSLCDTAWAYIFINATPTIVLTTNDSKCFGDSVGSITSVVTGNSPFVYSWSNADTLSSIDSLVAGIYTLMVMDSLGCTASATDTVNGPANALTGIISLQNVLCFGDSTGAIDLQVNGGTTPYSYSWSTADTTEDLDSLTIGIYSVTILDANLCQVVVVDSISQPDSALVASLTVADILCGGDSTGSASVVVSGGTPGYVYAWSTSDTISNLFNLYSGIYSVTITDAFSCSVVLTDTINDLNAPLLSSITAINSQCLAGIQGQINLQLNGGALPYIYNWSNGDSTAVLDSLTPGLYTVIVLDSNNCQVEDSVSIIDSSVYVLSTSDSILCQGDSTILIATGYADLVYNWYADGVLLTDTIAGIIVSQAGSYNVTSTNVCGVYASDTIRIVVNALPSATITGPSETVCDSAIVLSGFGGNAYSWNPAQSCTTPDQPSTSILLANSTTIVLNIVDTNGCTSSDSLFVTVTCDSLNIPSGFSPNGDGVNDYFYIENIERYPNAELKVFNRWGNLVYEKKNYDNSWNGNSNSKIITIGEVLPNGTYFYVLDLANDEDPIQGYIILRR